MTGRDNDPKPRYEHRVVAFLDILGFKNLVSGSYGQAVRTITALDNALEHTLGCIREQDDPGWVSIRTFSDCLCLSTEETYLPTLIDAVAFTQWGLAVDSIFVRGGISSGYHCETERMIFSQGLIRAYELQQADLYPRVLIAPDLVRTMMDKAYWTDWGARTPLLDYVLADQDGICFLDYLTSAFVMATMDLHPSEYLELHANAVRGQLTSHVCNQSIFQKHLWLAAYHNFRAREAAVYESEECPEEYLRLMEKLLIAPPESNALSLKANPVTFQRLEGS